jgi:ABC-type multidrug transport system ATPase subunit
LSDAIAARGLTKRFGPRGAVDALDLSVPAGELYGVVGPNGAGKSTLIRLILGLVHPTGGELQVLGEAPGGPALARVGALVEEPAFWAHLSARKNLEYLSRAAGSSTDAFKRIGRIDEVLGIVGLAGAAGTKVRAYSQGMRQRLGIALAVLGEPELLVLDEPTNGLDPRGIVEVRTLLRSLSERGTTVVISSHLLREVGTMCDRVGVMSRGRLVAEGSTEDLTRITRVAARADVVRVEVDELGIAERLVADLPGVELTEGAGIVPASGPGTLIVRLAPGTTAADVNRALVSAGLGVASISSSSDDLESAYLALVEEDDVRG